MHKLNPRLPPSSRPALRQPAKRIVYTKESILTAIRRATKQLGHAPSRAEFRTETGISSSPILRHFESWPAAVRAAGLEPRFDYAPIAESILLEDWARVAGELGRLPRRHDYDRRGKFSSSVFLKKFGRWSVVPYEFLNKFGVQREWADLSQLVTKCISPAHLARTGGGIYPHGVGTPPCPTAMARRGGFTPPCPSAKPKRMRLRDRPTYGNPIDFRGLRHEPANEIGVVFLFGVVAKELGFLVEAVQPGFPDCEAKREITPGKWQRLLIEFEFESRNFRDQGHPTQGCNIIVCWRHNWPACPLEVIELARVIHTLPPRA